MTSLWVKHLHIFYNLTVGKARVSKHHKVPGKQKSSCEVRMASLRTA